MSVTQRLVKSRLLGLARNWLCFCVYPDSNDGRENIWGIHEIGITGQDLKKKFSGFWDRDICFYKPNVGYPCFSKGLPIPVITHVKCVPEALTPFHVCDKWGPNWSL